MFENLGQSFNYFLIYTAVCCVGPMLVIIVGAVIAFRRGSSYVDGIINPDAEKMQAAYDALRAKYPKKTADDLVAIVIRRQSLRCGFVGAVTGLGGFVTLPVALPVDMVMTYRIQGAMVSFIARAYDHDPAIMQEERAVASLVMFGSKKVTSTGMKAATNVLVEIGGKTLSKLIPAAGALIGFGLNFFTTQATGHLAASVYSGRVQEGTRGAWSQVQRVVRRDQPNPDEPDQV